MSPAEPRAVQVPQRLIESVNKLVRTSQRMLTEIGREPTPEKLADRLGMPLEKVRQLLESARAPIHLAMPAGGT